MKIIVHCGVGVGVEVQPAEGQEAVSFTDIVASLEMAKLIVTNQWKAAMDQAAAEAPAEAVQETE
jgi:hypothetical protein